MKRFIEVSNLPNVEVTCANGKKYVLLLVEHLYDIPAADVVEVVRCGNCLYYWDGECHNSKTRLVIKVPDFGTHYTCVQYVKVNENHFCGYGERKEKGDG